MSLGPLEWGYVQGIVVSISVLVVYTGFEFGLGPT